MTKTILCLLPFLYSSFALAIEEAVDTNAKSVPMLSEPVGVSAYLQTFAGLAAVVVLIVAMAWMIKRMGNFNVGAQGALKVVASMSMGQRERIILLQVGEQQLLIGIAPGHINTLHELSSPLTPQQAESEAGNQSFADRMAAALKKARG